MKSRKSSNISERLKLPKLPPFFLDRTLGAEKLASDLRDWNWEVEVHRGKFNHRADDDEWITRVAEKKWRILTSDKDLETRYHEVIAATDAGIFILSDLDDFEGYKGWTRMLVNCKRQVEYACCLAPRPFVARISHEGNLYQINRILPRGQVTNITASVKADSRLYID